MVSLRVFEKIVEELRCIEKKHDVRVLYACESGSRAWGFASRDSDYDVRFIYVHPRDWYLSIEDRRDVIEEPICAELDISGWDLRKALRLMRKSNPPLLEWLKSPVTYAQNEPFIGAFRALARDCYSPARTFKHYLHMAWGNARDYLKGDTVRLKKYLYVLRPMLAARWIERGLGEPPMRFDHLVEKMVEEDRVRAAIAHLLARKKSGEEMGHGLRDEVLGAFIAEELSRLEKIEVAEETPINSVMLNDFFQRFCLAEVTNGA